MWCRSWSSSCGSCGLGVRGRVVGGELGLRRRRRARRECDERCSQRSFTERITLFPVSEMYRTPPARSMPYGRLSVACSRPAVAGVARLAALTGDRADRAGGIDRADAVVVDVAEVQRAVVVEREVDRVEQLRVARRAAVAAVADLRLAVDGRDAGEARDHAGRVDLADQARSWCRRSRGCPPCRTRCDRRGRPTGRRAGRCACAARGLVAGVGRRARRAGVALPPPASSRRCWTRPPPPAPPPPPPVPPADLGASTTHSPPRR